MERVKEGFCVGGGDILLKTGISEYCVLIVGIFSFFSSLVSYRDYELSWYLLLIREGERKYFWGGSRNVSEGLKLMKKVIGRGRVYF